MTGCELVIVGCSSAGLDATKAVLTGLADRCDAPLVVVQHRQPGGEFSVDYLLRNLLRRYTDRPLEEAEDKTKLLHNHIYLAPADYHLLVESDHLCLSADDPVNGARPSLDVAFDSASRSYGNSLVGVVLAGSSRDGVEGAANIEARGGLVIIQDPLKAESSILPCAAIVHTTAALVMPAAEIGPYLGNLVYPDGGKKRGVRATN